MLNIFRLFLIIVLSFTAPVLANPDDQPTDIAVTLTRIPIVDNHDAINFVDTCLCLAPRYYRFTQIANMKPILGGKNHTQEQKCMRMRLSAMDTHDFMGWYLIRENKSTGENQISGILGLDSNTETSQSEVSLIYLPKNMLWNQKGLTSKVLKLAREIVDPHQGKQIQFLKSIDQHTLTPVYEYKKFMGICSSIYSQNYASLISAYRSGFRVYALADKSFLGHEYVLSNPPYNDVENVPNIEEYLDANPGMRILVTSANKALELLANPETRTHGKYYLWHIHCSYSGIYTATKWVTGIGIAAAAVWYGTKG